MASLPFEEALRAPVARQAALATGSALAAPVRPPHPESAQASQPPMALPIGLGLGAPGPLSQAVRTGRSS